MKRTRWVARLGVAWAALACQSTLDDDLAGPERDTLENSPAEGDELSTAPLDMGPAPSMDTGVSGQPPPMMSEAAADASAPEPERLDAAVNRFDSGWTDASVADAAASGRDAGASSAAPQAAPVLDARGPAMAPSCELDADGDGVDACEDECPNDPEKVNAGVCGCGEIDEDEDGDGLLDCEDDCPTDPGKAGAGLCGCGVADIDSDGDRTVNCQDGCPDDPDKLEPGLCGCGANDAALADGGTCEDLCPEDPDKTWGGTCGCGVPDTDADGDGTADCVDACPADPNKTDPGACGCGEPDTDADEDDVPDCDDPCPEDPDKSEPGVCGCGVAETDTDADGTPDCEDDCPADDAKTQPGVCGCGMAEALCESLEAALLHRYSFDGTTAVLLDSVGGRDGTAVEATLDGTGQLQLPGESTGAYAAFPVEVVDSSLDVSFEAWLTWDGVADAWERILDVGRGGPVTPGEPGVDFLYLTCDGQGSSRGLNAGVYLDGEAIDEANADDPLPRDVFVHVVLVVDDDDDKLQLYVDGELVADDELSTSLSDIAAEAVWLGRSQFEGDPTFAGSFDEFRIYGSALSADEVMASHLLGPDAVLSND